MQPQIDAASNRSSFKLMQPQNDPVKNLNIYPCSHKLIAVFNRICKGVIQETGFIRRQYIFMCYIIAQNGML
ncbi:hypothetical protein Bpfe_010631 [Biomphalaria pfeifferi]|uniref:Uncharacterized protein n=1 Tax=Biomphalaria pfeifferi TaxID=112525 RepID=A0AAD8BRX1_BIOPF|nr:hypothetical protein Bpfe_010631 [Biomphalaria pfeifferi]